MATHGSSTFVERKAVRVVNVALFVTVACALIAAVVLVASTLPPFYYVVFPFEFLPFLLFARVSLFWPVLMVECLAQKPGTRFRLNAVPKWSDCFGSLPRWSTRVAAVVALAGGIAASVGFGQMAQTGQPSFNDSPGLRILTKGSTRVIVSEHDFEIAVSSLNRGLLGASILLMTFGLLLIGNQIRRGNVQRLLRNPHENDR